MEKVQFTLKGIAFAMANEAGLIPRLEDGKLDTSSFNRFWDSFFPELKEAEEFPDVKKLLESKKVT